MADLTQDQWAEQLASDPNAVILDVRTDEEVEDGYIPGSIQIDFYRGPAFLEELRQLDKSKSYYVYCRSGNRSGQACALMDSLGFERSYNLMGGFLEWEGDIED